LSGLGGADTLNGGDGNDSLYGGDGNDTLNLGAGGNFGYGGAGDDIYYFTGSDDYYYDNAWGTDEIRLPSGFDASDVILGGTVDNHMFITINGLGTIEIESQFTTAYAIETLRFYDTSTLSLTSVSALLINGTTGNDTTTWTASSADLTINGFAGADTITAGSGDDVLDGGDGNDSITGNAGNDTYIASAGFDTVFDGGYTSSGDILFIPDAYDADDITLYRDGTINNYDLFIVIAGLGQIRVDDQFCNTNYGIEDIVFENSDPSIDLQAISIESYGTDGNDYVYGITANGSDADIIDGRAGNDMLAGGSGNDIYVVSAGDDYTSESSGTDKILFRDDNEIGDLTMWRGVGSYISDLYIQHQYGTIRAVNQFHYTGNYKVESLELADTTTLNLTSLSIETRGTSGADSIGGIEYGASADDVIYGYGGNDNINGYAGNDTIYAGADNDNVNGWYGNDTLYGDAGTDTLSGDDGTDTLYGGDDGDTLKGGDHADTLYGEAGNDTLYGDWYAYETGADLLYGGDGADTLYGKNGNDTLEGGNGADNLYGESGADTFMFMAATAFNAVDAVKDFSTAQNDNIDISDVLDGYYTHGVDVLTDFVQITTNGSHSELRVDTTGSASFGSGTHIATIENVTGLTDEAALVTAGRLLVA
jgi:Ca2+-binding RTX toxin-like protein